MVLATGFSAYQDSVVGASSWIVAAQKHTRTYMYIYPMSVGVAYATYVHNVVRSFHSNHGTPKTIEKNNTAGQTLIRTKYL